MKNKFIVVCLIFIMITISLNNINAEQPTINKDGSEDYGCNCTECNCSETCLCKNPNYKEILDGSIQIQNDDRCYRCNESCNCSDDCSCKYPISYETDNIGNGNNNSNFLLDLFNQFLSFLSNIIPHETNDNLNSSNNSSLNDTNITNNTINSSNNSIGINEENYESDLNYSSNSDDLNESSSVESSSSVTSNE